jgi:hypothetical protein
VVDEGAFEADSVVCPSCDKGRTPVPEAPCPRPSVGAKSPRHTQPNSRTASVPASVPAQDGCHLGTATATDDGGCQGDGTEDNMTGNQMTCSSKRKANADGNINNKWRSQPPKVTGRKDKEARVKIAIRKRVKIPCFQLYHILKTDHQRSSIPKTVPNNFMFFGTVTARGRVKNTWNVRFDVLPQEESVVENISRTRLTVVVPGEEEQPLTQREQEQVSFLLNSNEDAVIGGPSVEKDTKEKEFCNMDKAVLKDATKYIMKCGNKEIVWEILCDTEYIIDKHDPLVLPEEAELLPEIHENVDKVLGNPADSFFRYVFPDIKGEVFCVSIFCIWLLYLFIYFLY